MSFDVTVFSDMTRLMVQHPEWLAEMRRLIFTDEVLTLPDAIRELTEAQARTEKRLAARSARSREAPGHEQGGLPGGGDFRSD